MKSMAIPQTAAWFRIGQIGLLVCLLFAISYIKETYIINVFGGDWLLNRKFHGYRWGTVGYDVTVELNKVRIVSGFIYIGAFVLISCALVWVSFKDNVLLVIHIVIYGIVFGMSLVGYFIYKNWLWDGYFVFGTRLKELVTSPMYILLSLIIMYMSKQKS